MKNFKRILALVLAVMMVATSVVAISAAEADDAVVYNAEAITRLNKLGIFQGYSADDMGAEDNVTREQMALFTGRVLTGKVESNYWESYVNDTTFEDIDDEADYYIGAISYAYEQGIVIGKSDVSFDPKGNVTYQEALTMVVRSLGYTGLSYPNGFINKAMKLGLTNGIANVAYGDAAVRGVIATVLYNALYAEDSLFADNFNLTSGTYMLVATPTVVMNKDYKIPGAAINGYIGKKLNEGYVAFAPIGDDYKAVNQTAKYVYAKTSQISDDIDGNYAHKLGYAYNLTFENDVLTWGDECATKTFVNYGDDRDITATYIDYDHKFDAAGNVVYQNDWFLTFGGQAYNLTDGYDADYTAPTGTHDLILYADFGAEYTRVDDYVQCFDKDGNIINGNTGAVLLYLMNGAYYKLVGTNYVKATTDEILDAITLFEDSLVSDYVVVEGGETFKNNAKLGLDDNFFGQAADFYDVEADYLRDVVIGIAKNYFCEITAMDYDNDGIYDAAVYVPYYLGNASSINSSNVTTLTGVTTADGSDNLLKNIDLDNYVVTGKVNKLGAWGWYVYSFNRHTNTIDVKEVAKSVSGKVEWGVKGAASSITGIYEDSQVSIGGTTYQVGGWNYQNLLGLKQVASFDGSQRNTISNLMGVTVTSTYYNGWNDVLDFGMTDACAGFKGYAIAGHLIHGVPTPSASATYSYVAFNAYQSEFALENDQIVVDAIVDASGKYQTIKINSVDSMEFTELEYQIFVEYCNVFYANVENKLSVYSYYLDADRLAVHQSTPLYKAIERAFIIDRLTCNYVDLVGDELADAVTADKTSTLVFAVNGKNADGSYQLLNSKLTTVGNTRNPDQDVFEFTLGISDYALIKDKQPIRTNANTVFTFVAKDGIYTYVGMPADGWKIDLTGAPAKAVVVADSDNIMIMDTTRCITDIAVGTIDWAEKVQDVVLDHSTAQFACTCDDGEIIVGDNLNRCDAMGRLHIDTWAFVEYVPYVSATFHADEVYMVTAKTSNTKIYFENGVQYYVYSNLYNLVDCKYEESVIFTGEEVAVFNTNISDNPLDTSYESGNTAVGVNYGTVITRDDENGVWCYTYGAVKSDEYANDIFNLADWIFNNPTNLNRGVYGGVVKDNTGAVSHVIIDGAAVTVNKVEFVTTYWANDTNEIGTFDKIATGAVIFYTYDAVSGTLTGYAFN